MTVKTGTAQNHVDFIAILEALLTQQGHAWGQSFVGVGTGRLTGTDGGEGGYIGGSASVAESFEITATSSTTFSVVGSVGGNIGTATVGTAFASTRLNFLISAGATAFAVGDKFYLNTSPAWSMLKKHGCRNETFRTSDFDNTGNLFDSSSTTYGRKTGFPGIVTMEMVYPDTVGRVELGCFTLTNAPKTVVLEYSDNGVAWTSHQTFGPLVYTSNYESLLLYVTGNPGSHRFWRIRITEGYNATTLDVGAVRFANNADATFFLNDRAEIVFEGPGLDGSKSILIGARFYEDVSTSTYNFSMYCMRAYNPLYRVSQQLPAFELVSLPATNVPFTYWMFVNGHRMILILKVGVIYVSGYFGFGHPYEQPSVHDFPMIMAGASSSETRRVDSTDANHRGIADPGRFGLKAWYPVSGWRSHANFYDSSGNDTPDTTVPGFVWPNMATYGTTNGALLWRENLDGSLPLIPVVITHADAPKHVWGEMDGVFVTTGFNNSPETVIRQGRMDYKVFQNMYRATFRDFFAVRMD